MNQSIQAAAEFMGNGNKLAHALGVSRPSVAKWIKGGGMDVRHAFKIEELTGGIITARQISDGISGNYYGMKKIEEA